MVELVHDALIHPLLAGEQLGIQQRLLLNKTTLFCNKMQIIFFFFLMREEVKIPPDILSAKILP